MSPNRVDFEKAIEGLRSEDATAVQRQRALAALPHAQRTSRLKIAILAAVPLCGVAAALLALPAKGSAMPWVEVVRRTQSAVNIHDRSYDKNGNMIGESWYDGVHYADLYYNAKGNLLMEMRRDDQCHYFYFGMTPMKLPNAYHFAELMRVYPGNRKFPPRKNTLDEVLSNGRTKIKGQQSAEVNGHTVERFDLLFFGKEPATVDVDPASKRIQRIVKKGGEVTVYDYPDTLDPAIFSWKSRITKSLPVLDTRSFDSKKPYKIPDVIASKGGIQLREVSMGSFGTLYVSWTGDKYARLKTKPFRVAGVRSEHPWYGPGPYLDGKHKKIEELTVVNVALLDKIGDRITLEIPTGPHTYVEFKNVPVSRLRPLDD